MAHLGLTLFSPARRSGSCSEVEVPRLLAVAAACLAPACPLLHPARHRRRATCSPPCLCFGATSRSPAPVRSLQSRTSSSPIHGHRRPTPTGSLPLPPLATTTPSPAAPSFVRKQQ